MNAKDAIRNAAGLSQMVVKAYIGDLTDAELMTRPGPGCNHIAWQLGHLISSGASLLNMVAPEAGIALPAGFAEKHTKETNGVDDPSKFYTKQEYLDLFDKSVAASMTTLEKYPEADLDKPSPEPMRSLVPTMGGMFMLIATHPLMHAGQFVPVRRALGKPVVI